MIYFIADMAASRVKIGYSADPWRRFHKVQSDCAGEVRLLSVIEGCRQGESELHRRFADDWVRGEWFRLSATISDFIATRPQILPRVGKRAEIAGFWNGMSGSELARQLGVHKSHISEIRTGKKRPSPELAIQIQRLTGVSAVKLVFGDLAAEAA